MDFGDELMLENARSILDELWHIARFAQDAAESLEARIEDENLSGMVEAIEVRVALERLQALNIEVSEELDACHPRYAHQLAVHERWPGWRHAIRGWRVRWGEASAGAC